MPDKLFKNLVWKMIIDLKQYLKSIK
jgi:hypothetical protein